MRVLLTVLLAWSRAADAATSIEVHPSPGFEPAAERIEAVPPATIAKLQSVFGVTDAGTIIVTIAGENSSLAREVPEWVAGYAIGSAGVVVLFPERATTYPHNDLIETYLHELAHVFTARAAGDGEVPRWFHESIALATTTAWGLQDQSRTTIGMVRRWNATPDDLEQWFRGSPSEARRAYAISEAFGRDFLQRYGVLGVQRILARVRDGVPFEHAFQEFTGRTIDGAWYQFWDDQTFVHRTIPIIGSGTILWLMITFLAIIAFRRRRERDAQYSYLWELEEEMEQWKSGGEGEEEGAGRDTEDEIVN